MQALYAGVAELADAQDLKSCGLIIRAGSIPAICTRIKNRVVITLFFFLLRKNGRIEKDVAKLIRLQQQSMSEG